MDEQAKNEERFSQLFRELDINKDGRVDVKELQTGLKRLGVNWTRDQAQVRKQTMADGRCYYGSYKEFYALLTVVTHVKGYARRLSSRALR